MTHGPAALCHRTEGTGHPAPFLGDLKVAGVTRDRMAPIEVPGLTPQKQQMLHLPTDQRDGLFLKGGAGILVTSAPPPPEPRTAPDAKQSSRKRREPTLLGSRYEAHVANISTLNWEVQQGDTAWNRTTGAGGVCDPPSLLRMSSGTDVPSSAGLVGLVGKQGSV